MNLSAIVNPFVTAVNPNFIGSLKASTGDVGEGDAVVTGSISGTTLTVTDVTSGNLAANSELTAALIQPPTLIVSQLTGSPAGGIGTYRVSISQTLTSTTITATGTGKLIPSYSTTTGLVMQVQAVSGDELRHVDGLNIQGIYRAVYINGRIEGADRPGMKGGDLLMIPTGLTATPPAMDTWLVKEVMEPWDAAGWCKALVVLQGSGQYQ